MAYKSKNHHYVSRFYLEKFACDSRKSWIYSMNQKNEIYKNKISKICSQNNYNSPEQEGLQSMFERAFASILKDMMENPDATDLNLNLTFLKFVAFMLGNNIKTRKSMAESISSFELQIEGLDSSHKVLIDDDHRGRFDLSLAVSNALFNELRDWNFIRREIENEQKVFITSDSPVSIFNPEDLLSSTYIVHKWKEPRIESFGDAVITSGGERGVEAEVSFSLKNISFQKDVMMIFPITPTSCLIGFSDSDRYTRFMERTMRSPDINELINTITFRYSNKAAYSPTKKRLRETITQLPKVLPVFGNCVLV